MLNDIYTIMWKELREFVFLRGNMRGGMIGLLLVIGVFGIFLPLQFGAAWVQSPTTLIFWSWLPLFMVISVIADSFAGERERHTLETMLASRLPDMAILLGKVAASVAYGWAITLLSVVLSLVTINLTQQQNHIILYSLPVTIAIIALSFLGALLAAGAGILVSLRSNNVRQAQQKLSLGVLAILFIPTYGFNALPENIKISMMRSLSGVGSNGVLAIVGLVLLALDVLLLMASAARFRRSRLILD